MATKQIATPADVREWARDQGYEIGDRGRISSEIAAAYNKAQGRRGAQFITGDELAKQDAGLSVSGVRRGTRDGKQVFEVDVAGTLTFTVPS